MRVRLVAIAAAGATVLLGAGTAYSLSGNSAPASVRPAAVATGSIAGFPTTSGTATSSPTMPPAQPGAAELSADEAAAIAVAHVGGGRVTQVESELEHGRREWKVRVANGAQEHDVRVDALSGAITRTDRSDDGNRAGRSSDDRGYDDNGGNRGGDDRGRGSDDRGYDDHRGDRRGSDDSGSDDSGSDDR
jgi:hypothetical protein